MNIYMLILLLLFLIDKVFGFVDFSKRFLLKPMKEGVFSLEESRELRESVELDLSDLGF